MLVYGRSGSTVSGLKPETIAEVCLNTADLSALLSLCNARIMA